MRTTEYAKNHDWAMTIFRSFTLASQKKAKIIYLLLFLLTTFVIAYLIVINIKWESNFRTGQIVFVVAFLMVGICHIFCFPKWMSHPRNQAQTIELNYSVLLAVMCGFVTFLLFKFTDYKKPQLSLAGAFSFLFPLAVYQAWKYFDYIAPKVYEPWFLPAIDSSQNQLAILLNSIEINIKIKVNYFDLREGSFPITVPGSVQLGIIFQRFLLEMEKDDIKIRIKDEQGQPYSWLFSMERNFGRMVLDPDLTLTDNKVRQKSTILIERIKI